MKSHESEVVLRSREVVLLLSCRTAKCLLTVFSPHLGLSKLTGRKMLVYFSLFCLVLRKSYFEALVKTWFLTHFSFPGEDLHLFSLSVLLLLPCSHHSFSFYRFKCYALQEESNAFRTLLQPSSTPHDSGAGSPPNSLCAVVWANVGWQCQQVCLDHAVQQFLQVWGRKALWCI